MLTMSMMPEPENLSVIGKTWGHCLINCLVLHREFLLKFLQRSDVVLLRSQQTVMVFKAGCSNPDVAASEFKAWNFTANGLCSWPKPAVLSYVHLYSTTAPSPSLPASIRTIWYSGFLSQFRSLPHQLSQYLHKYPTACSWPSVRRLANLYKRISSPERDTQLNSKLPSSCFCSVGFARGKDSGRQGKPVLLRLQDQLGSPRTAQECPDAQNSTPARPAQLPAQCPGSQPAASPACQLASLSQAAHPRWALSRAARQKPVQAAARAGCSRAQPGCPAAQCGLLPWRAHTAHTAAWPPAAAVLSLREPGCKRHIACQSLQWRSPFCSRKPS